MNRSNIDCMDAASKLIRPLYTFKVRKLTSEHITSSDENTMQLLFYKDSTYDFIDNYMLGFKRFNYPKNAKTFRDLVIWVDTLPKENTDRASLAAFDILKENNLYGYWLKPLQILALTNILPLIKNSGIRLLPANTDNEFVNEQRSMIEDSNSLILVLDRKMTLTDIHNYIYDPTNKTIIKEALDSLPSRNLTKTEKSVMFWGHAVEVIRENNPRLPWAQIIKLVLQLCKDHPIPSTPNSDTELIDSYKRYKNALEGAFGTISKS